MRQSLHTVRGAFALAAMDCNEPDVIVAARRISPLVVGTAPGVTYLASDVPAILDRATAFYAVNDDEVVRLGPEGFRAIDLEGAPVRLRQLQIDWDLETAVGSGLAVGSTGAAAAGAAFAVAASTGAGCSIGVGVMEASPLTSFA